MSKHSTYISVFHVFWMLSTCAPLGVAESISNKTKHKRKSGFTMFHVSFLYFVTFFSRILCKHRFYDCHAGIINTFLIRHSKEHPRAVSQQRDEFKGGKKTTMRKTYNYQQCVIGSNEPIWKKQSKKLQKHHICIQHQRKHKLMKPSLLWLPPSSCIPSKLVNEPPSIYSF